jgi:hypothetical protein
MASSHWSNDAWYDSNFSSYWSTQTFVTGAAKTAVDGSALHGSQVQIAFTRLPSGLATREDEAIISLHLTVEAVAGTPGVALTATQAAAAEGVLNTWWTTVKAFTHTHCTLKEYRWRDFGGDFAAGKTGLSKPGPIWRVTANGNAGTASTQPLPEQSSSTVTFQTGSRRHWGRVYMPGLTISALTGDGRIANTYRTGVGGAFQTLYNSLFGLSANTSIMIWSPKYRGLMAVKEIAVDDVPDVIRRRRPKQRSAITVYTS